MRAAKTADESKNAATTPTRATSSLTTSVRIFFFQAEDGIRDRNVTGVQTCALPICARPRVPPRGQAVSHARGGLHGRQARSEERRVGKEWRFRWSPLQVKKNGDAERNELYDTALESFRTRE